MPPSASITLYSSPRDGIIALPSGPASRWAVTALDLAQFESADEGVHVLPTSDLVRVKDSLDTLYVNAARFDVAVSTTTDPFIGDVGRGLARRLDGSWRVEVGNFMLSPSNARSSMRFLWDSVEGPLACVLKSHADDVAAVAFLRSDETGFELAALRSPRDGQIVVGALAPEADFASLATVVPVSVTAPDLPAVLEQVAQVFLPSYEHALAQGHHRLLERHLDRIRAAQDSSERPDIWWLSSELCRQWYGLDQHLRRGLYGPLPEALDDLLNQADLDSAAQYAKGTAEVLEYWRDQGTRLAELVRSLDPDLAARPTTAPVSSALPPGLPGQVLRPGPSR
ncbi:hypothetical protein ACWGI1_00195 [Streptomyces sp. NPDC054835]|uniref:hypothetical protein n=1 Tax=Streptomyces exfoliatus TaxID=1905 RepID=UPI000463F39C|nr:hypothetical protein [Streptomyces exfoliatus]